jgi:8-oxo-dGTP diphosphatase
VAVKKFPSGTYGKAKLTFFPAPYRSPIRSFASLVIPIQGSAVLLAHIGDRGWCIPSGRVEAGEDSIEAARRECMEETGATLTCLQYIGCYQMSEKGETRWSDLFVAKVGDMGEISKPKESLGRKFVEREDLPTEYYFWNDLTRCVFDHAFSIIQREK